MSLAARRVWGGILWGSAVAVIAGRLTLAADFAPARLSSGSSPQMPLNAVGWVDARLDVGVDEFGAVSRTNALRATPGALASIEPIIASWRLKPAEYLGRPVRSAVLVVAMFRPPQLYDNAPGGSPPVDLGAPSEGVPFPMLETRPKYPPSAFANGVVIVEVLIGIDGKVEQAVLAGPGPGFESAALEAARGWVFTPARHRGQPVPAYAYLIFGFRGPIAGAKPSPQPQPLPPPSSPPPNRRFGDLNN